MSKQIVSIPDLGGAPKADVIEIHVKVGDSIAADDTILTLEGDKASMDVPSPFAGVVESISVSLGDKVSEGTQVLVLNVEKETGTSEEPKEAQKEEPKEQKADEKEEKSVEKEDKAPLTSSSNSNDSKNLYASPIVRRTARELNINLAHVSGTGPKGRLTREDLTTYVRNRLSQGGGSSIEASPVIDFSQWGEISTQPLNKIKRLTAENMTRAWRVPQVTQFEEADITDLEVFRKTHGKSTEASGYKLTPLAFVVKAVAHALKVFPEFNSSLDSTGENLVLKHYVHVGVAVDTPQGLMVPVLFDADKQSCREIAKSMADLSLKARNKALMPKDMMGSSFTISSLGGIGGTGFTPIVNPPNVAILGVSKAQMKPVYCEKSQTFVPRLMMPFSLSYDHRVIDGAQAARFAVYLRQCLEDLKLLVL